MYVSCIREALYSTKLSCTACHKPAAVTFSAIRPSFALLGLLPGHFPPCDRKCRLNGRGCATIVSSSPCEHLHGCPRITVWPDRGAGQRKVIVILILWFPSWYLDPRLVAGRQLIQAGRTALNYFVGLRSYEPGPLLGRADE